MPPAKSLAKVVAELKAINGSFDPNKDVRLGIRTGVRTPAEERLTTEVAQKVPAYCNASDKEKAPIYESLYSFVVDDGGRFFTPKMVLIAEAAAKKKLRDRIKDAAGKLREELAAAKEKLYELVFPADEIATATKIKEDQDLLYSVKTICLCEKLMEDGLTMLLRRGEIEELQATLESRKSEEMAAVAETLLETYEDNAELSLLLRVMSGDPLPVELQSRYLTKALAKIAHYESLERTHSNNTSLMYWKSNFAAARAADILTLGREALEGVESRESRQLLHALDLDAKEKKRLSAREKARVNRQKQEEKMLGGKTVDERLEKALARVETMQYGIKWDRERLFSYK